MIVGLYTEMLANGGVQRMARHMAAVQVRFCRAHRIPCVIYSLNDPSGPQEIECEGEEIRFEGFNRAKWKLALRCMAKAGKTKLAFINHPNLGPLGLMMQFLNGKCRYIVHTHGIDVWTPLSRTRRAALRRAECVTGSSRNTLDFAIKQQEIKTGKTRVLYPALDTVFLRTTAGENHAIPEGIAGFARSRYILTVTRLVKADAYKGVDTTISALKSVQDVDYVIVGDGDDLPRLKALAESTGVANRVHFAGRQSDEALRWLYEHCSIFVMPSSGEGFGIVFLEAMAYRRPCIGGADGGTPEAIRNEETGFVLKPGDAEKLGETIFLLLNDDDLAQKLGRRGREIVEKDFAFPRFSQTMDSIMRASVRV